MADSTEGTLLHKRAVTALGMLIIDRLVRRFEEHDNSKLEEPELGFLNRNAPPPKGDKYEHWDGSATENFIQAGDLRKFLEHHYKVNRHHPQHFDNGVDGMDLIDLIEMFVDWAASSFRTKNGNIYRSIQFSKGEFKISPQLANILMNTATNMDQVIRDMKDTYTEEK